MDVAVAEVELLQVGEEAHLQQDDEAVDGLVGEIDAFGSEGQERGTLDDGLLEVDRVGEVAAVDELVEEEDHLARHRHRGGYAS